MFRAFALHLLFQCIGACAQWVDWENTYPYQDHRVYAHMMHRTLDGNLLMCGTVHGVFVPGGIPFEDYSIALYLVKTTPFGDTLWTRTLPNIQPSHVTSVVDLMDGNLLVAGTSDGPSAFSSCTFGSIVGPSSQLFTLKIDQQGNTIWHNHYDQPCDRTLVSAWQDAPQEIRLLAFMTNEPWASFDPPHRYFEVYDLDAFGNIVNMSSFDQEAPFYFNHASCRTAAGDHYLCSSALDTANNTIYARLGHLTPDGALLSWTTLSNSDGYRPLRVFPTLDGGLLMISECYGSTMRATHLDTTGAFQWERTFGSELVDGLQLPDSTYLILGTLGNYLTARMSVTRLSLSGDSISTKLYGDTLPDRARTLLRNFQGYSAFGTKDFANGSAPSKMMLAMDTVHLITSLVEMGSPFMGLQVYPDPARTEVSVRWTSSSSLGRVELTLYDALGHAVVQRSGTVNEVRLQLGHLPRGLHVLRLRSALGTTSRRLVLE